VDRHSSRDCPRSVGQIFGAALWSASTLVVVVPTYPPSGTALREAFVFLITSTPTPWVERVLYVVALHSLQKSLNRVGVISVYLTVC
jgi:hypothetical protein